MIKAMCKGQQHELQWSSVYRGLTDAQFPSISLYSLSKKPLKIRVSATVAVPGTEPFPCHFTSSEAGSWVCVANIARESCLKLVIVVGNLMNVPMPVFALICQMISWYHCKSHHIEWTDWGLQVCCGASHHCLGHSSSFSPSKHSEPPKLSSRLTTVMWELAWALQLRANISVYVQHFPLFCVYSLQEDSILLKPFMHCCPLWVLYALKPPVVVGWLTVSEQGTGSSDRLERRSL